MAAGDVWGNRWGNAWGSSWRIITAATVAPTVPVSTGGAGRKKKDWRYSLEIKRLLQLQAEFQQEQERRAQAQKASELPGIEIEAVNEVRARFSSVIEGARINLQTGKNLRVMDLRKEITGIKTQLKKLREQEEFFRREEEDILAIARLLD